MYPSDYIYASGVSECLALGGNADNCQHWLFVIVTWFITPSVSNGYRPFSLFAGVPDNEFNACSSVSIFPVLYLKSSITITGGSGTSSDLYTLG